MITLDVANDKLYDLSETGGGEVPSESPLLVAVVGIYGMTYRKVKGVTTYQKDGKIYACIEVADEEI